MAAHPPEKSAPPDRRRSSPFEVAKANPLFGFVVVALSAPAQFGDVDKLAECDVRRKG
jgi:hypothetical protein